MSLMSSSEARITIASLAHISHTFLLTMRLDCDETRIPTLEHRYYNVKSKRFSKEKEDMGKSFTALESMDSMMSGMKSAVTGHMFVVMEIAEAGSFYDHCDHQFRSKGPFSEDRALEFFKQIVEGLQFMHDRNFVHRDMKLENMLLGGDFGDVVKLCDFGFSTWIKRAVRSDSPKAGNRKGLDKDTLFSTSRILRRRREESGSTIPLRLQLDLKSKVHETENEGGFTHYVAPEVLGMPWREDTTVFKPMFGLWV